jgi:hypothetical protein
MVGLSQRSIKFFARSLWDARVLPTLWPARNSDVAGRCLLQRQVRTSRRSDVYRAGAGHEADRLSHPSRNIGLRPAISLSTSAQTWALDSNHLASWSWAVLTLIALQFLS